MAIVARSLFIALLLATVVSPALAKPLPTEGSKVDTVPARSDPDDPASDSATLEASMSRVAQRMAAARQPNQATPASKPDPVRATKAHNTIRLTNLSGAVKRNYPLQFGRPFVCGEIPHSPQVLIDGTPAASQADVKNRCPDGSVKFAVISAVIPALPASGSVMLTFQDQPGGNSAPIAAADLLAQFPDFDATIKIAGAAVAGSNSASARAMLADGACKPWTSGPVAQTMICGDRSAVRKYDIGSDAWRSLHPEFIVTFWPATKQVFVRFVGEIANTQALEAFAYNLTLTAGKASPVTVYQQTGIQHSIATRWTRTAWIGGAPEPKVNIDHNIGYLADTYWLPNFDRSLRIPEDVLAAAWAQWNGISHNINDPGLWQKDMPGVAYHPDIGPMPLWYNRAIYSGDWRMRQVMLWQADLAGAFGAQLREGDATKFVDRSQKVPGVGRPTTVYARPTSWLFDGRVAATTADAVSVHSPRSARGGVDLFDWSSFQIDTAHQPDPFFVPYLMTGDPFYLDGLQFWAARASFMDNPDYRNFGNAVIYDGGQPRADAWVLRTRLHAALASPDADPMKAIFNDMIDDGLAYWEGLRGITGTKYEGTPLWKFAHKDWGTPLDGFQGLGPSPLGWWGHTNGPGSGAWDCTANKEVFDVNICYGTNAPWQQNFLVQSLARAVELGFAADRLLEYASRPTVGALLDPNFPWRKIGQYQIPDAKRAQTSLGYAWFQSWAETATGWAQSFRASTEFAYWPTIGAEVYADVWRGALGMTVGHVPNADTAWKNLLQHYQEQIQLTGQTPNWNLDPTWAIIPRRSIH